MLDGNSDVKSAALVSNGLRRREGGEPRPLFMGSAVSGAVDLNADGVPDLIVGAFGTSRHGSISFVYMNTNGSALDVEHVTLTQPGRSGGVMLADGEHFGGAVAVSPDHDGDQYPEQAVGAYGDETKQFGAVYRLVLQRFAGVVTPDGEEASGST